MLRRRRGWRRPFKDLDGTAAVERHQPTGLYEPLQVRLIEVDPDASKKIGPNGETLTSATGICVVKPITTAVLNAVRIVLIKAAEKI